MTEPKSVLPELEFLFHPRSVAVVGVSLDNNRINGGRWLLDSLISARFQGKIYAVGAEGGEYAGLPLYRSLKDIPGRLDYVIVAIPAAATLQLAHDAAEQGAKALHFFTAGFSELGGAAEITMEKQLLAIVREKGMRLLGPNCMGIYYPSGHLAFFEDVSMTGGHFGLLSQSGGNAIKAIRMGPCRGLFFSKAVSYGNGADINEIDLLEYFTADLETRVIGMYIEGTRDGHRCFTTIKRAAAKKPFIVYKGGNTEIGRSATLSHTGSLSGTGAVWSGMFKQVGAIEVNDMDEIIDLALLFTYTIPSRRTNTAIIGLGGGAGVLIADTWAKVGLAAPQFPPSVRAQLGDIFKSEAGRSLRNPIDVIPFGKKPIILKTISAVTGWEKIDYVLLHLALGYTTEPLRSMMKTGMAMLTELPEVVRRRILVVIHEVISPADRALADELEQICRQVGLPVFHSPRGVALALSRYAQYNQKKLKF